MSMKGSTCKREGCEEKFHACGSCDIMNWENDYCSAECHEASKREAFERISKQYGIDPTKMDDLFSDLSEWVEYY
jgi:hypothetical protein